MSREEILLLIGGFQALHPSFLSPCRAMQVHSTVGEISALSALDIGQHVAAPHPIVFQLVVQNHSRRILQTLDEPLGSFRNAPSLNQGIQDDTVLVRGTPQIIRNALVRDERLIEMPLLLSSPRRRHRQST